MNLRNMMSTSIMPKIQEYLKGVNFPVSKQEITSKAQQSGADSNIMSMLQKLPDRVFQSQSELTDEVGKVIK